MFEHPDSTPERSSDSVPDLTNDSTQPTTQPFSLPSVSFNPAESALDRDALRWLADDDRRVISTFDELYGLSSPTKTSHKRSAASTSIQLSGKRAKLSASKHPSSNRSAASASKRSSTRQRRALRSVTSISTLRPTMSKSEKFDLTSGSCPNLRKMRLIKHQTSKSGGRQNISILQTMDLFSKFGISTIWKWVDDMIQANADFDKAVKHRLFSLSSLSLSTIFVSHFAHCPRNNWKGGFRHHGIPVRGQCGVNVMASISKNFGKGGRMPLLNSRDPEVRAWCHTEIASDTECLEFNEERHRQPPFRKEKKRAEKTQQRLQARRGFGKQYRKG